MGQLWDRAQKPANAKIGKVGTFREEKTFLSLYIVDVACSCNAREAHSMTIFQRRFLPVGAVVVFLLAGCGYSAGSGVPPSPTGGPPTLPVSLQAGAAMYQRGSPIRVMIKNLSGQTIYFADHRTNCTVLLMELQVADSWEPVAPCRLMIATHIHALPTGETSVITITPSNQWPVGHYRARLDYSLKSGAGLGTLTPVYSNMFVLG